MTHYDDDEIGTILDLTPRGLRVMWLSGEETEEVSGDLILAEHLMGWDGRPAYPEAPDGR